MTSNMLTNSSRPSTANYAPLVYGQGEGIYMMPVQPQALSQGGIPRIIRPVPGVKCLSIATVVLGSVLAVLGIVATLIQTRHAFLGDPIWTGLLFLLTTGILGIFVHKRKNNLCMNIAFLVMTIVSSVAAFQLFVYTFKNSFNEYHWGCTPYLGGYMGDNPSLCTPVWARIAVDVVILLCSLSALVVCIISCSLTIYGTFTCCYSCCFSCCNNPPAMVHYSPNSGFAMLPVNSETPQMISPVHVTSHGSPYAQQTHSQPLLIAAPQPLNQNLPLPHMVANVNPSTPLQSNIIPGNQQGPSEASCTPSRNRLSSSEDVRFEEISTPAQYSDNSNLTKPPSQIADNPQNWQKF